MHHLIDLSLTAKIIKTRKTFSHKGTFGHSLIVAGSRGMVGAAILAAEACLRSGAGLVSIHSPLIGYPILQTRVPEAMVSIDPHESLVSIIPSDKTYQAVGIGPGLGTNPLTRQAILTFLNASAVPLVVDADALNCIAEAKAIKLLPKGSIITPHPGEFIRLFGESANSFERLELQKSQSKSLGIYIILKGAYTSISTPEGAIYFNSTGNPGMATAGSGDVLTGIITGLLSQKYTAEEASILGVFVHGLAGDLAANKLNHHALLARDIIDHIGAAFNQLLLCKES